MKETINISRVSRYLKVTISSTSSYYAEPYCVIELLLHIVRSTGYFVLKRGLQHGVLYSYSVEPTSSLCPSNDGQFTGMKGPWYVRVVQVLAKTMDRAYYESGSDDPPHDMLFLASKYDWSKLLCSNAPTAPWMPKTWLLWWWFSSSIDRVDGYVAIMLLTRYQLIRSLETESLKGKVIPEGWREEKRRSTKLDLGA